jgi:hypothetical protein
MKFKIAWSSPRQGIQSTTVDAINTFAAQEQVESMYAHIDGFRFISVSPVFDKKEYSEPEQFESSHNESSGGDGDDLSVTIGGAAIGFGALIAVAGLFFLPVGIVAMIIGGAIGFLGMKLAEFLSDRGW